MLRCIKCNFLNEGDHPVMCRRCGKPFVYHKSYNSYVSRNDEDDHSHVPTFGSFDRDRWNHDTDRPKTFVEDAMQDGRSGGGGASASFDAPERQDDPDPPSDNHDSGSSDSGSDD
jgi:hypothetical protein